MGIGVGTRTSIPILIPIPSLPPTRTPASQPIRRRTRLTGGLAGWNRSRREGVGINIGMIIIVLIVIRTPGRQPASKDGEGGVGWLVGWLAGVGGRE